MYMQKLKIGVLCPSEIAFRRFAPSLKECEGFQYIGVAVANEEEWSETVNDKSAIPAIIESENKKAESFSKNFGGKIFTSYKALIASNEIDCVYVPLPPALHYRWGMEVLKSGKHLFMEKPFTTSQKTTKELLDYAKSHNLAVHENYMFIYHSQLDYIMSQVKSGKIGDIRNIRVAFTFPMRQANDFRYNKALGGGALLDCAGYPVRLITYFLGKDTKVDFSRLNYIDGYEVDFYGSAVLSNDNLTAQMIFGMDNSYKCELEIQGSKGIITTGRIFTAPAGFEPTVTISIGTDTETVTLPADNSFKKSIERFYKSVTDKTQREEMNVTILKQAQLIDSIKR